LEKGSYVHGVVTEVAAKKVAVKVGVDRQVVLTPEDGSGPRIWMAMAFCGWAIWCI